MLNGSLDVDAGSSGASALDRLITMWPVMYCSTKRRDESTAAASVVVDAAASAPAAAAAPSDDDDGAERPSVAVPGHLGELRRHLPEDGEEGKRREGLGGLAEILVQIAQRGSKIPLAIRAAEAAVKLAERRLQLGDGTQHLERRVEVARVAEVGEADARLRSERQFGLGHVLDERDGARGRLGQFARGADHHEGLTGARADLGEVVVVLEHAALDHDLHAVGRHARLFVHRLLERRGGLGRVERNVVQLAIVLDLDGDEGGKEGCGEDGGGKSSDRVRAVNVLSWSGHGRATPLACQVEFGAPKRAAARRTAQQRTRCSVAQQQRKRARSPAARFAQPPTFWIPNFRWCACKQSILLAAADFFTAAPLPGGSWPASNTSMAITYRWFAMPAVETVRLLVRLMRGGTRVQRCDCRYKYRCEEPEPRDESRHRSSDSSNRQRPSQHEETVVCRTSESEQVKVVELVVVLGDGALDLARVDPGDEILHIPRDHERWIRDGIRTHSDMTLLDVLDRLSDRFGHLEPHHHHGQTAPAERGHVELVRDVGHLGARIEESHIVQLGKHTLLVLAPERIRNGKGGKTQCEMVKGKVGDVKGSIEVVGRMRSGPFKVVAV
ncbi:hypothetical protein L1887_43467 [Cichorium endivia]|nr:hypothetical protein L1887_43467 [Cichorium endivia]